MNFQSLYQKDRIFAIGTEKVYQVYSSFCTFSFKSLYFQLIFNDELEERVPLHCAILPPSECVVPAHTLLHLYP